MALNTHGDATQALALRALAYLAAEPDRMGAFMGQCGIDSAEIRQRAGEPEFLGFVLDHLLGDDSLVIDFAEGEGIDPASVMQARMALPGGDTPEWT